MIQDRRCYVAMGDSFTAGTGCSPGQAWTERIAAGLEGFKFHNLAQHGATSANVRAQLGPAMQLEPDLVSVICGANDVLYGSRLDLVGYSRNLAGIFSGLRSGLSSVRIVTATAPERWEFLPVGPRTRARLEGDLARMNVATRSLARTYEVALLEVAGHDGLDDSENFARDGLHPSGIGHARTAQAMAALLAETYGLTVPKEVLA